MKFSFFGDAPDEVVSQLSLKKPELHFNYNEIRFNAHQRAFTVAKVTRLDLLSDIQESLENALKKGQNFKEWKQEIIPTLIKKGWWGDEVEVMNPKNGEKKMIKVDDSRLKTIFNTNIKTAYAMANYDAGVASGAKYIRYVAVLDHRTRQSHADMHGIIKPINDKFWEKNYPPNGWNCRCSVMFLDEDYMKDKGWSPTKMTLPNIADKDWAYHVGKNTSDLMSIYKDKIANLENKKLEADFIEQSKKDFLTTLSERVENLGIFSAIKSFFKTPYNIGKNSASQIKIINTPQQIKNIFQNENLNEIYLSEYTISTHKHHKNISEFDYFNLKNIFKKPYERFFKSKTKKEHFIFIYKKNNIGYKVVLKKTDKNEIFVQSLSKGKSIK